MMLIDCPWCGARNQDEFSCGGQAHIERPQQPESVSDRTWAEYQFVRLNSCGLHFERWQHIYGCGQWFHMARDTRTHEIKAIYLMHEDPPEGLQ
jgi:sarcosine oxidase subunit delta